MRRRALRKDAVQFADAGEMAPGEGLHMAQTSIDRNSAEVC
jgi:hypothetical protein